MSCIILYFALTFKVDAQAITDGQQTVENLLKAFGPVPYTHSVDVQSQCKDYDPNTMTWSYSPCLVTETVTTNAPLSLTGTPTLTQNGNVSYGALITQSSPDKVYSDSVVVENCLDTNLTSVSDKTLSLSISVTSSTTITQGISHVIGGSVTVRADPKILGSGFGGLDTTFSYSETVSTSTAQSTGQTQSWTDSVTIHVPPPPPKSAYVGILRATLLSGQVPFTVAGVLDAPVSANDRGYAHISDFLSELQRTATIAGVLNVPAVAEDQAIPAIPTTFDPSQCTLGDSAKSGPIVYSGNSSPVLQRQTLKILHKP